MLNQLRFIKRLMYSLKRRYGVTVRFLKYTAYAVDPQTGTVTSTVANKLVRRAIAQPNTADRTFFYDLTMIASNKNFIYGAITDRNQRKLVIDREDVRDWQVEVGQWFLLDGKRYEVSEVIDYQDQRCYFITGVGTENGPSDSEISASVSQGVSLTQEAANE